MQGLGLAIYLACLQQDSVAKEEIELMRPSSSHRLHVRVFTAGLVPLICSCGVRSQSENTNSGSTFSAHKSQIEPDDIVIARDSLQGLQSPLKSD